MASATQMQERVVKIIRKATELLLGDHHFVVVPPAPARADPFPRRRPAEDRRNRSATGAAGLCARLYQSMASVAGRAQAWPGPGCADEPGLRREQPCSVPGSLPAACRECADDPLRLLHDDTDLDGLEQLEAACPSRRTHCSIA